MPTTVRLEVLHPLEVRCNAAARLTKCQNFIIFVYGRRPVPRAGLWRLLGSTLGAGAAQLDHGLTEGLANFLSDGYF